MTTYPDAALEAIGTGKVTELPSGELLTPSGFVLTLQVKDVFTVRKTYGNNRRSQVLFSGTIEECFDWEEHREVYVYRCHTCDIRHFTPVLKETYCIRCGKKMLHEGKV